MSIFGQVWVFSAVAFVLGAVLAWLFLVVPARRRIRELERRIAAGDTPRASGAAAPTAIAGPVNRPGGDHADDPDDDRQGEHTAPPPTRRLDPAAERPTEVTEHLTAAPSWPEQDSLQGRLVETGPVDHSSVDDDFAELDALSEYDDYDGVDGVGDEDGPTGAHSASEVRDPGPGEPTEYHRPHGERPAGAEGDPGTGHRRGGSLFDPTPVDAPYPDEGEPDTEPPAYAFGGGPETGEGEPFDHTAVLPKRRPGRSPMESFDPPGPAQPSMRPVARRDPEAEQRSGGSLFEPAVAPSGGAGGAPPAREAGAGGADLPGGPFGPGSAMPQPGGARPSPDFTVKASVTALRYCVEGSDEFPRMVAEVWFRTPADAERVGFRPLSHPDS